MNVSILTIGDEICIGQIVNTNAAWIASQVTQLGANVKQHSAVSDELNEINAEFDRLLKSSDVVLVTGGLGPTHDDITRTALCEYFHDELVFHEPTFEYLKERYARRGVELSERNKFQAMLPSTCEVLKNSRGTAPGMLFKKDKKILVSMPGVPNEMKGIMKDHVLPLLKELMAHSDSVTVFKTLLTNGIPESNLADLLGDTNEFLKGATLAFLPSYQGVRLRIGSTTESFLKGNEEIARVEKHIRQKAGKYIYGEGDQNLALAVGNLLKEKNKTVALAESCTGGLLGAALTDAAGSSQYFMGSIICYSNEAKIELLNVPAETILNNGAVSCEVAEELAKNVRLRFKTDYGISITGIAGPGGGTTEKPVGTVWIGIADENSVKAQKFIFGQERMVNRELSVGAALGILLKALKN